MENKEVLISGASIAGPALALLLRRAGFSPTVVERAPALRPGGQAVDLRGAGRTVIASMGLTEQMAAVTLDQRGFATVDASGRLTSTMPRDAFGGEGLVSEVEILRGDMSSVLYDESLPGTEYLFDDTITGLDQDEDGVTVTFDNAPARRFALVFGADGLHSTVRRLAFGEESALVSPLGCYTAWFTARSDIDLDGWYQMHNAPGGLVASARPGRLPGELKCGFSFRSEPFAYDRRDIEAQKKLVAERFAGLGWHVPGLLAAMQAATDFSFDSMGQVHLDRWSRGRVALVGDAAYCPTPLTGLGTSLALVGAYLLAGELSVTSDHRAAFARYEELMRPYVRTGQELPPRGVKGYAPGSALEIKLRDLSMRMMTRWPVRNLMAGQFAKADSITLPAYAL